MLAFIGAFVGYLLLAAFIAAFFYVAGTYLLLSYDRKIARGGEATPPDQPPYELPRGGRYLWQVFLEVGATFLFILLYPIGMLARRPWVTQKVKRRPILFVHGLSHNQSAFLFLRLRLRWAGFGPLYSVNIGRTGRPVEALAQEIDRIAKQIEDETKIRDLVVIGHSMGGIVSAYYNEEIAPFGKISHLITLGTPFSGTRLACFNPRPSARQMRPSSELLQELKEKIYKNTYTRYCQIASSFDNIVYPYQSALLEGKDQLLLKTLGHLSLLFAPKVADQVIYWLKEGIGFDTPDKRHKKRPQKRLAPHH